MNFNCRKFWEVVFVANDFRSRSLRIRILPWFSSNGVGRLYRKSKAENKSQNFSNIKAFNHTGAVRTSTQKTVIKLSKARQKILWFLFWQHFSGEIFLQIRCPISVIKIWTASKIVIVSAKLGTVKKSMVGGILMSTSVVFESFPEAYFSNEVKKSLANGNRSNKILQFLTKQLTSFLMISRHLFFDFCLVFSWLKCSKL